MQEESRCTPPQVQVKFRNRKTRGKSRVTGSERMEHTGYGSGSYIMEGLGTMVGRWTFHPGQELTDWHLRMITLAILRKVNSEVELEAEKPARKWLL